MKKIPAVLLALGLSAALFSVTTAAQAPTIVMPSAVHWQAGYGPVKGAQVAVLWGNPAKAGEYALRIKMPNGLVFAPHFHSESENVTVLQGTLMVGLGDKVVKSKMVALPTGSFVSVPPGVHHYAMARGVTILQINSIGPRTMMLVKP